MRGGQQNISHGDPPRRSLDAPEGLLPAPALRPAPEEPFAGATRASPIPNKLIGLRVALQVGRADTETVRSEEMLSLFERHRDAEAARDYDRILATFVEDCFLETQALGLRNEGQAAVRKAYKEGYFTAFPDLEPEDEGHAFGDDVMVVWGTLRGTSEGEWMGVAPSGRSFAVPFANVTPFRDGLMAGESIYFDLATLCEQAALPLADVRAAARQRARPSE
jgi:predicted ester cyclase